MVATIIVSALTCASMMVCVLVKPSVTVKNITISLYWIIALVGAVVLVCGGWLSLAEVAEGLTADTAINPLKILVLFFSMTVLSIFLDEVGFFAYLANFALKKAKASQTLLFVYLYLIVSILTVFTSNDIIILTFTPFICYFSKNAKINPVPYLVTEFVAANTWSMMLLIGNPTNIYLATANGVNFAEYVKIMFLPTVFGGITSFAALFLTFKKQLSSPLSAEVENVKISDKPLLIIGVVHLGLCTVAVALSSLLSVEMWLVTLAFALSLFVCVGVYKAAKRQKPTELVNCLKRVSWELAPFVLSMFVVVLALEKYGVTEKIGEFLASGKWTILTYGVSSFVVANLVNNIPMSVLFSAVVTTLPSGYVSSGVFAAIVGSNVGAFFTPVGALAGIMWESILKKHDVKFGFGQFVRRCAVVALPTLLATLAGLYLVLGA